MDREQIKHFSTSPGVYLMKNKGGGILYIGKAKNLRTRVQQYFNGHDTRPMIPYLIGKVKHIDTVVLSSEKEALLLENTLIKRHQPKYNALLKDDKGYVCIKITKEEYPTLIIKNYKDKMEKDGVYFGPYTSKSGAKQTISLLQKLFALRQCSSSEMQRCRRPCLLYQMGRCLGPCAEKCSLEEYNRHVKLVIKFLRGQNRELLRDLNAEMGEFSKNLEFEKANATLKTIQHIENIVASQKVDFLSKKDMDVIATFSSERSCFVSQLFFRAGKLIGVNNEKVDSFSDEAEVLRLFLMNRYKVMVPHEIVLPFPVEDMDLIEEVLSQDKKRKVKIAVAKRGKKFSLIEMARKNAEEEYKRATRLKKESENLLHSLQKELFLEKYPRRIECFDNSHFAGDCLVAGMTVFIDGKKSGKHYRKYKIRGAFDDYSAMEEVFRRRRKDGGLPDLIIVDGGKGHLSVARKVFSKLDIIAIAKEKGRHDKGLSQEQIFTKKGSINLDKTSPLLFLLQKIRDETHRFAIAFHRQSLRKNRLSSKLEDLPGIGPQKTKLLLTHFKSIANIKKASPEELRQVKGLSAQDISNLQKISL